MTEKILKSIKKRSPVVLRRTLERKRLDKNINKGKRSKIFPENSENPVISDTTIQADNLSENDTSDDLKTKNKILKDNLKKVKEQLAYSSSIESQAKTENKSLLEKIKIADSTVA